MDDIQLAPRTSGSQIHSLGINSNDCGSPTIRPGGNVEDSWALSVEQDAGRSANRGIRGPFGDIHLLDDSQPRTSEVQQARLNHRQSNQQVFLHSTDFSCYRRLGQLNVLAAPQSPVAWHSVTALRR